MTTATARALLDWYRTNVCDTEPRSAHVTLNRSGPLALTACSTAADFDALATAFAVAVELVKEMTFYNITGGYTADIFRTPPPGYEVQFNNQRASLWLNGELLADATTERDSE